MRLEKVFVLAKHFKTNQLAFSRDQSRKRRAQGKSKKTSQVSPAAADKISRAAALAQQLFRQKWTALKEEQRTALRAFLTGKYVFALFLSEKRGRNRMTSPFATGSGKCAMSPAAPVGSLE